MQISGLHLHFNLCIVAEFVLGPNPLPPPNLDCLDWFALVQVWAMSGIHRRNDVWARGWIHQNRSSPDSDGTVTGQPTTWARGGQHLHFSYPKHTPPPHPDLLVSEEQTTPPPSPLCTHN